MDSDGKKKPSPDQLNGNPPERSGRRRRGRKPTSESRAPEIRARLMEWKQTPKSFRSSLRALAADMGTSHQLLSFYLQRLDEWQDKRQGTEYERQENAICARARAENRPMTQWEESQVVANGRAACRSFLRSRLAGSLRRLQREIGEACGPTKQQIMKLEFFARWGFPMAQKILATYSQKNRGE